MSCTPKDIKGTSRCIFLGNWTPLRFLLWTTASWEHPGLTSLHWLKCYFKTLRMFLKTSGCLHLGIIILNWIQLIVYPSSEPFLAFCYVPWSDTLFQITIFGRQTSLMQQMGLNSWSFPLLITSTTICFTLSSSDCSISNMVSSGGHKFHHQEYKIKLTSLFFWWSIFPQEKGCFKTRLVWAMWEFSLRVCLYISTGGCIWPPTLSTISSVILE